MKKFFTPLCIIFIAAIIIAVSGFKKENEVALLQAKVADLENQLAAVNEMQSDSCYSFNYVYGDKKMIDFLAQNQGKPGINAITMRADSLKKMFNGISANNLDPVTVAMIHSAKGVELSVVNIKAGTLCGPGICCPPRCREEWLGILNIPETLPSINGQKTDAVSLAGQ